MDISSTRRMVIELREDDIDGMREIARLAYARLHSKPATQMHGSPHTKQAGLSGPDLYRVKTMLERLGVAFESPLPYDAVVVADPFPYPVAIKP